MEEQEEKEEFFVVLVESGYGILRMPNNFVVARLKTGVTGNYERITEDFERTTYEFYSTLSGAFIGLSSRLLDGKLRGACKTRALSVRELADILKEHHRHMKEISTKV